MRIGVASAAIVALGLLAFVRPSGAAPEPTDNSSLPFDAVPWPTTYPGDLPCATNADCDDDDPCSIDRCEQIVNGTGWCGFHPYTDLTDAEILAYGHDPASFDGCCTPGKELTYCTDHLVIVDDQVVHDACWNVGCVANQCRYGKDPDPLCCNTGFECDDCAEFDVNSGQCIKTNFCTLDLCVANHCVFECDPFHQGGEHCCMWNTDCSDDDPATIDTCDACGCHHAADPWYCDPSADPPVPCPAPTSTCEAVTCNPTTNHCERSWLADCCATDAWCIDVDPCTDDVCDPVSHTCSHPPLQLPAGELCCYEDANCDDDDPCTFDECWHDHRCYHYIIPPGYLECPPLCDIDPDPVCDDQSECTLDECVDGFCRHTPVYEGCCATDAECASLDRCSAGTCVDGTCQTTWLTTGTDGEPCCLTDLDCDDGLEFCTDACIGHRCRSYLAPPHTPTFCEAPDATEDPACDDGDPCTLELCFQGFCRPVGVNEAPPDEHIPYHCCIPDQECGPFYVCTELGMCAKAEDAEYWQFLCPGPTEPPPDASEETPEVAEETTPSAEPEILETSPGEPDASDVPPEADVRVEPLPEPVADVTHDAAPDRVASDLPTDLRPEAADVGHDQTAPGVDAAESESGGGGGGCSAADHPRTPVLGPLLLLGLAILAMRKRPLSGARGPTR